VKCCESVVLGSGKRVFCYWLRMRCGCGPAVTSPGMGEPAVATGSGAAISLDCDYVGTSAPPQIRCYDNSSVILPGADEVLKLGDRPWLSQVLNCVIDPA
jgi:hypothetical protein